MERLGSASPGPQLCETGRQYSVTLAVAAAGPLIPFYYRAAAPAEEQTGESFWGNPGPSGEAEI